MKAKISLCIIICLNTISLSADTYWLNEANPKKAQCFTESALKPLKKNNFKLKTH